MPSPVLRYSLTTDTPRAPASNRSLCVQVISGFAQFGQSLAVKSGANYALTAWVRVRSATSAPVSVGLGLQAAYSPWVDLGRMEVTLGSPFAWNQLTMPSLTAVPQPAVAGSRDAGVMFLLWVNTPGAVVCVDDASMVETGACGRTRLAVDPGRGLPTMHFAT